MSMLESKVDLSTIAIWLGHESVQTTHRYMIASMSRKEDALAKGLVAAGRNPGADATERRGNIPDFLESL